ncbi:MAG: hypothetical protein ACRDSP_09215 [Pseudonocardiaceae bacterium]
MARQDSVEVAAVLARLTKAEQDARDNVARVAELSDDAHGRRCFSEGEVSALRGAQKLIRELADWPVEETPLLADWPSANEPSGVEAVPEQGQ